MPSPETTIIQKVIIVLFIVTIVSSCISLLLFTIDKPSKQTIICELSGSGLKYAMKPVSLNMSLTEQINSQQFQRNCTTKINPPMSPLHTATTDIATGSVAIFFLASAYAYATRKKEKPIEPPGSE